MFDQSEQDRIHWQLNHLEEPKTLTMRFSEFLFTSFFDGNPGRLFFYFNLGKVSVTNVSLRRPKE